MEYFLEKIAQSLHSEFANKMNHHCLVFPNRRAGLYFLKYLSARIEAPVWMPSILTINELFRSYSTLQLAGNEILLFELYKIYRKLKKSPESFDEFYFWGDMLLNDFDDVDKHLVDSSLLFSNILDIKSIDQQFGGLTEQQIDFIRRFWINFDPERHTSEKTEFLSIWSILSDLYTGYKYSLKEQNLAYEGMIFRELAENSDEGILHGTEWEMIHFIGFNALNECEKVIMTSFKKAGRARFYWDYDNSYVRGARLNSAGFFLNENLKLFGNDMPADWSYDTLLSAANENVSRRIIDTSSDVAQVKLISDLIGALPGLNADNAHHTAIVLADENLLMPVLTSLPENVGDINITMGHPLKQTLVYTLVKHLMDLQRSAIVTNNIVRFNFRNVICILKHTLVSGLMNESDKNIINDITLSNLIWIPSDYFAGSAYLSRVFIKPDTPLLLSDYFKDILSLIAANIENKKDEEDNNHVQRNIINEFIYRIVLSINRLEPTINSSEIIFTTDTYIRILDRMLRIQSVPFSGEPLSGIQIMGILETRALDFKNLIILSVNEGVLPAVSAGSSFIPFSLREAFGLPSINHQESIYAYHFYRLLHRAANVTFTFNSNTEGLNSGEMSRFLIQMKYESEMKPDYQSLNFEIKTTGSISDRIDRTGGHVLRLQSQFLQTSNKRILSPSAINTWLSCRMKFYYRYVNGLKEPERVTTDIDPAMLGNIVHDVLKHIYQDFAGKELTEEIIESIIRNKQFLTKVTNTVISEKFNRGSDSLIGGNELIVRDVLMTYILRVLKADKNIAPLTILNLEESFEFPLSIILNGSQVEILTGGKIDRVDSVSGAIRIVDYKTGTVAEMVKTLDDMFIDDRKKDTDGWLQTLLYCEAYLAKNKVPVVYPSIYNIKKLSGGLLNDKLKIKTESREETLISDYASVRDEFLGNLKKVINLIFSNDEPFLMTSDIRGKCSYCPYRSLCNR